MQIQLKEEQMEWLRAKALERRVSISQLVREGIAFFREHEEHVTSARKERALAAIGRFASGVQDASERHDDYLADLYARESEHGGCFDRHFTEQGFQLLER
jgi:hypothetical protein